MTDLSAKVACTSQGAAMYCFSLVIDLLQSFCWILPNVNPQGKACEGDHWAKHFAA